MYTFEFNADGTMSYTLTDAGRRETKTGAFEVIGAQGHGPPEARREPGFYYLYVSIEVADSNTGRQIARIDRPDKDTLTIWPQPYKGAVPFRPTGMAPDDKKMVVLKRQ